MVTMGRGRNGILNQSRKKNKTAKNAFTTPPALLIREAGVPEVKEPIKISQELLEKMKTMSAQVLKNQLITQQEVKELEKLEEVEVKEVEELEEMDLNEMEEFDLEDFDLEGEPVYETPIMTSHLADRIIADEFTAWQVEYILKKALKL